MSALVTLFDGSPSLANPALSGPLRELYGGDLWFPEAQARPHVVANFVSTLDGVVSYGISGKSGGGPISAFNRQDAFVMGLLRAYADAVMVGSGTLHGDAGHVRTAPFIFPEAEPLYVELRAALGKRRFHALNVIVSGSGRVDLREPTFRTAGLETVIVTSDAGRARLAADHGTALRTTCVRVADDESPLPAAAILKLLYAEFGVRLLLHEGGPTLFGQFLADGLVDELFLTVAPRLAGRSAGSPRPGIVEGVAFPPEGAPEFRLASLKRAGEYLFHRWIRSTPASSTGSPQSHAGAGGRP